MIENAITRFEIFATGLDHPEGLAFDRDGNLWAGGEAGQIYRIDSNGQIHVVAECGGFTLGMAFSEKNELFVCNSAKGVLRVEQSGKWEVFADGMVCPNFPAFDSAGNLWVSDSGKWKQSNGRVLKFHPDGAREVVADGWGYTNGLCFDATGTLHIAESDTRRILRLDGSVVANEVGRTPDGLALAPDGSLFCACYASDDVWRITPQGELQRYAHDPDAILLCRPTNLSFHDGDLYVTNLGRTTIVRCRL
jgi:gluconolactonase